MTGESDSHPSNSSVQTIAERAILSAASGVLGIAFAPKTISLPGGSSVRVDGFSESPTALLEVYARQGPLKGGQPKKVATDALKLIAVKQLAFPDARIFIALASDEAAASLRQRSWLAEAFAALEVQILVVEVDESVREAIRAAQIRQRMINPPA